MPSYLPGQIEAAAALTRLLEAHASFSYLRLGDGELDFLVKLQENREAEIHVHPDRASVEIAHCCPGMEPASGPRLLRSYEQADYVDLHDHLDFNRRTVPRLVWRPKAEQRRNSSPEGAGCLLAWTIRELPGYLEGHHCLFFGPEAGLLRELLADPDYRSCSGRFWDRAESCHFLEPVGGGLDLSRRLDELGAQLDAELERGGADTVFISLGGAAKILCAEIAARRGIRAIDFGSMMRMLTYSGSAGHAMWRASYLPYLFSVPYGTYMRALQRISPDADPRTLLIRAQSQLCLELQHKESGAPVTSDVIDGTTYRPTEENRRRFLEGYALYCRHHRPLAWKRGEALAVALAFEWWVAKKGLGSGGAALNVLRRARRLLAGGRNQGGER